MAQLPDPPNGAADKLRAATAQAQRSAEASVSFIRWMGGRERSEREPAGGSIRRPDGRARAKSNVAKRLAHRQASGAGL